MKLQEVEIEEPKGRSQLDVTKKLGICEWTLNAGAGVLVTGCRNVPITLNVLSILCQ